MDKILGIVADDLTGAGDTAVQFALRGIPSVVVLDEKRPPLTARVIAAETESRGLPVAEAASATADTARFLNSLGVDYFYKKIDSLLRGNLSIELESLMDTLRIDLALVAPAYPSNSRITAGGYHLAYQTPVAESEACHDPVCPVRESHLPTLLRKNCRRKVGHLELNTVIRGEKAIATAIRNLQHDGVQIIACDATTEAHLKTIAGFLLNNPGILGCGTAGLAKALAELLSEDTGLNPPEDHRTNRNNLPVLTIVGSRSPVTAGQILNCRDCSELIAIDLNRLQTDRLQAVAGLVKIVSEVLGSGKDTVVYLPVSAPLLDGAAASNDLASVLGDITFEVLQAGIEIGGLILSGGDIAKAVSRRMEVQALEVLTEFAPAVPCSRFIGGLRPGLKVVTKGGACGDPEIIKRSSQLLRLQC